MDKTDINLKFYCLFNCVTRFDTLVELRGHLASVHLGWLPYQCEICKKNGSTEHEIFNHSQIYHPNMTAVCKIVDNIENRNRLDEYFQKSVEIWAEVRAENQEKIKNFKNPAPSQLHANDFTVPREAEILPKRLVFSVKNQPLLRKFHTKEFKETSSDLKSGENDNDCILLDAKQEPKNSMMKDPCPVSFLDGPGGLFHKGKVLGHDAETKKKSSEMNGIGKHKSENSDELTCSLCKEAVGSRDRSEHVSNRHLSQKRYFCATCGHDSNKKYNVTAAHRLKSKVNCRQLKLVDRFDQDPELKAEYIDNYYQCFRMSCKFKK